MLGWWILQILFILVIVGLGVFVLKTLFPRTNSSKRRKGKKSKDLSKNIIAAGLSMDVREARSCLKELAQRSWDMDISGFKEFIAEAKEEDFDDKARAHILVRGAIEKVQIYRANHTDVDCDRILSGLIRLAQLTQ